jgi:Spy/CpxP family protein refolding chaperone
LDLSEKLGLTDTQKQKIQTLFEKMKDEAQPIGQQFLDVEDQIDTGYAQETITDQKLKQLLTRSGDLYGKLRHVHLKYHFQTKEILTRQQVERYNELRGYASHSSSHHSG